MQTIFKKRKAGKRISPERIAAESGAMTDEQFEFLMEIDKYKRKHNRSFVTWTEGLEILKSLGYAKKLKVKDDKAESKDI